MEAIARRPTSSRAANEDAAGTLPTWMRRALLATAVMNGLATLAFLPVSHGMRALIGMPEPDHPLYLATVGLFVLLFGVGYLLVGLSGRPERLFIGLAAAGKLGFVALVATYWMGGALPLRALIAGSGDLPFGVLFATWLYASRSDGPATGR